MNNILIRSGPQHSQFIFLDPLPPLSMIHVWYYSAISSLIYSSTVLTTLLHLMQTKGTSYQAEMLHYTMFHPMNQQKDLPQRLDKFRFSQSKPQIDEKWCLQLFHTLLVLLPSTHTFQVHARLKEHFATCTSFAYKQLYFLVYITVNLYTSVSTVIKDS
jgi:hypothetical protein